jgi:hypothetical protein
MWHALKTWWSGLREPPQRAIEDAGVHAQLLNFAKKAEKLAQTAKFTKFVEFARKDLGGVGELALFFFTQSMMLLYTKTGDHAKAVRMMQEWLDGIKKQTGG